MTQTTRYYDGDTALAHHSLQELEFPKVLEHVATLSYSTLGEELIMNSEPTPDTAWLREEHDRIDDMIRLLNLGEAVPLEGISDVRSLLHKSLLQGAYLLPNELLAVRDMMRSSRQIRSFVNIRAELVPTLTEFCTPLHDNRLLEKHISEAIDDTGAVRDTASFELQKIRREILDTSQRLRQRLQKILKKVSEDDVVQEEFISQRDGRFVLPMKVEYKRHIPGIIHSVSGSGQTVFVEPAETFEMNNDLSLLHNEEQREIERILTTLTAELAVDAEQFLHSLGILARIDAIFAKARYAREYDCIKPDITNDAVIQLSSLYHPLLVQTKGKKNVTPLSILFDDSESPGHLISGPNAGGKTVALKSIGLNLALALAGFFPCGYCRTNYRTIYTAIGDNQSIENDVSTFSSQILRLKEILLASDNRTLALIDEICSGTDPQEGSALAVGIMEGFLNHRAFFVVTTHQSSLKSYALTKSGINNACMEFNSEKMTSTYKFLSGVPGNSYAFALAKTMGLPADVLAKAQDYLGDSHSTLEKSIEVIQEYRREAERLRRESEDVKLRAEKKKLEYEQKFSEFKQKYQELMRLAKQEAADIVHNANKLVEQTIRELRETAKAESQQQANAQKPSPETRTMGDIKKSFDRQRETIEKNAALAETPQPERSEEQSLQFQAGDMVLMEGFTTPGTVITLDPEHHNAVVEFDAVKFRTTVDKLSPATASQIKKAAKGTSTGIEHRFDAPTRLDLRGMYADEAVQTVEKSIAAALTGSVHTLTIVHGKGTGALRQAIQNHLSHHPAVREFRNGLLSEGGAGVTVVELK